MISTLNLCIDRTLGAHSSASKLPILGIGVTAFSEACKAANIVRAIQESGLLSLSPRGESMLIATLFLTPVSICISNEVVQERNLPTVEKIHKTYQKIAQAIYIVSMTAGLVRSIHSRRMLPVCQLSSSMAGILLAIGSERECISNEVLLKILGVLHYTSEAARFYLTEGIGERLSILSLVALKIKLARSQGRSIETNDENPTRLGRIKNLAFKYLVQSRQMRRGVTFFNPLTRMVAQFDLEHIRQGTEFLRTQIYEKLTKEGDKDAFQNVDGDMMYYAFSKAVYLYAFGEKKSQSIPQFFKEETQIAIQALREKKLGDGEADWLRTHFESPENYRKEIPSEYQTVRNAITGPGTGEGQGGMLILKCWTEVSNIS
ncbi:MAG: hypothetical protein H7A38_05875 [Chlamydiales bacterium]|nr:hypothetical protein [Chlamydiales bacterium]